MFNGATVNLIEKILIKKREKDLKAIKVLFTLVLFALLGAVLSACSSKDKYKITLAEVTHSVFYAPQYVALELGYFEEEGLNVELILASGADKTMAALLSKDAQIGLMGPEASIFVYNGGQTNYAINFIQLTQCDGSFLLAREPIPNFTWDMLNGKEILGGRKGGVPEMTLEYVLKSKGLEVGQDDPTKKVNVRTDVQFAAMGGAFASGEADFCDNVRASCVRIRKARNWLCCCIYWQRITWNSFYSFCATKDYLEKNSDIIQKFTMQFTKHKNGLRIHCKRNSKYSSTVY